MHRAIETRYAGYRFRSRLEARYAVFFDSLRIKWDYEPEGFELPSGRYLPDFFVRFDPGSALVKRWPGAGYWVEIKPLPPTERERVLFQELCHATTHHGYLFVGRPAENVPIRFEGKPLVVQSQDSQDAQHELTKRLPPRWLTDPFEQTLHAACIACCAPKLDRRQLEDAAVAARSARFEFKDAARRRA